jgi:hypothetical protein
MSIFISVFSAVAQRRSQGGGWGQLKSHHSGQAVIRVYDEAGNVIETQEHA